MASRRIIQSAPRVNKGDLIGGWSFLVGLVLAVILGAMGSVDGFVSTILIILGLIVGFLNVSDKETNQFLLAGITLVIVASFGAGALQGLTAVADILHAVLILFVPATIIVALKSVFQIARR